MKHDPSTPRTLAATLILSAALIITACTQTRESGNSVTATSSGESVSPEIEAEVRQRGQAIAAEAFGVLSSQLGQAIADAGLTNAISFCSVHGLKLTTSVGATNEVVLRRVTHKPRNPVNRADEDEMALIRQFQNELDEGKTLKPLVTAHRPGMYTFNAPIVLNLPLCLNCHGQPGTNIQPATLAQIQKLYPADEATGFKMGQLRGMWSIDFRRSDLTLNKPESDRQ